MPATAEIQRRKTLLLESGGQEKNPLDYIGGFDIYQSLLRKSLVEKLKTTPSGKILELEELLGWEEGTVPFNLFDLVRGNNEIYFSNEAYTLICAQIGAADARDKIPIIIPEQDKPYWEAQVNFTFPDTTPEFTVRLNMPIASDLMLLNKISQGKTVVRYCGFYEEMTKTVDAWSKQE